MWNIRGLYKKPSMRQLKKLIKLHSSSLIIIMEPKIGTTDIEDNGGRLGCQGWISNQESTIWILWKQPITCNMIVRNQQYLSVELLRL